LAVIPLLGYTLTLCTLILMRAPTNGTKAHSLATDEQDGHWHPSVSLAPIPSPGQLPGPLGARTLIQDMGCISASADKINRKFLTLAK
jgi:hypothetical protein